MSTVTDSIEIRSSLAGLSCDLGDISETVTLTSNPGVLYGVSPMVIFSADIAEETARLARFGITQTVVDDIVTVTAANGTWVWRLQPAHWRPGDKPPDFVDNILLGRWPD